MHFLSKRILIICLLFSSNIQTKNTIGTMLIAFAGSTAAVTVYSATCIALDKHLGIRSSSDLKFTKSDRLCAFPFLLLTTAISAGSIYAFFLLGD
jgi:hypothetical protein